MRIHPPRPCSVHAALSALLALLVTAAGADWPPKGTSVRLPVTRDAWLSRIGNERFGSHSSSSVLRIKGHQDLTVFDVDVSAVKGRIITGALLHVHWRGHEVPLRRASVSTVATPWVEGTVTGYKAQAGSVCFQQAALGKRDWAFPGGNIMNACLGRSNTIWAFADATPPDAGGWQAVAVSPEVIAARAAGLSQGFVLYDDVGYAWSLKGEKFEWKWLQNCYFHSKESGKFAPYLEVWTLGADAAPPEAVGDVTATVGDLPAREAMVSWITPADRGGGRTLGFHVTATANGRALRVPRYLIPMAAKAGERVRMHIRDLPARVTGPLTMTIRAVDSAGNAGAAVTRKVALSTTPSAAPIPRTAVKPFAAGGRRPQAGGLKVTVVDLLDKIHPLTGEMIPAHAAGYRRGNHLWSAARRLVRLHAARNEAVCFQVNLEGTARRAEVELRFADATGLKPRLYRFDYVGTPAGPMPDVLLPQRGAFSVPFAGDPQVAGAKNVSVVCEVYVPHKTPAGPKRGRLRIAADGKTLEVDVELTVWDFALPDKLSFVPEMNCYGAAGPGGVGLAYYRVAHEHRLCLNRLYYHWSGLVDFPPDIKGGRVDWRGWKRRFEPLLNGSAFADLPRAGEPVDAFYLPFNENWPVDIYAHYTKSYWFEDALSPAYRRKLGGAIADFARMADRSGWHGTIFEFFLNAKVYYKDRAGSWKGSSAPWCLDEPTTTQDFWALAGFGRIFHDAVDPVRGKAKVWYRADISMTPYGRTICAGLTDREVLGGWNAVRWRMKQDDRRMWDHHTVIYGSANPPGESNALSTTWCYRAWTTGCMGVLPWQTIAKAEAWQTGKATALFYRRGERIHPSVRVKAFRRGQQDIEYLTWFTRLSGHPQWAVGTGVRRQIDLTTKKSRLAVGPVDLWRIRMGVGQWISTRRPPYRRKLIDFATPRNTGRRIPEFGYVRPAPKVTPATPG